MLGDILIFVNNDRLYGATKATKCKRVKMGLVNNALKVKTSFVGNEVGAPAKHNMPDATQTNHNMSCLHIISLLIHFEGATHLAQKTSRDVDGISGTWAHVYHRQLWLYFLVQDFSLVLTLTWCLVRQNSYYFLHLDF